jgi:hypothetical protein
LSAGYFGGAAGAVVSSLALWVCAEAGLLGRLAVSIDPDLSWPWLSQRILWGGIWGLGLPLVLRRGFAPVRAGLMLSLAPSALQLFYFLPVHGYNMLGVALGALTPIVVLIENAIWGWSLGRIAIAVGGGSGAKSK